MAEHCRQIKMVALALGLACAASAQDTPFILGVNGHPFQQEAYWQVPLEAQLALVKEAGLQWYRTDWGWADFERSDQLVAAAEVAGVKLLPILFPDVSAANGEVREVRRLAFEHGKAIAERYRGRISHYELSNELECQVTVTGMAPPGRTMTFTDTLWPVNSCAASPRACTRATPGPSASSTVPVGYTSAS